MKTYLEYVLVLTLAFYVRFSSNLPPVPDTNLLNSQILGITIFYEGVDEDTGKFFKEFDTAYQKLKGCLFMQYEPCMYADYSSIGQVLQCQNLLDSDCTAAKVHVCAISIVKDSDALYKFVSCAMQGVTPDFKGCAKDAKIDYNPIQKCATSDQGTKLCYESSKTRPQKIEKIPSIAYGPTFDASASDMSLIVSDLVQFICSQFNQHSLTCPACPSS